MSIEHGIEVGTSNFTDHVYTLMTLTLFVPSAYDASVRCPTLPVPQLIQAAFENSNYLLFYHKWQTENITDNVTREICGNFNS